MSAWYIFYDASIEPITGTLVAWMVLSSSWQINRLLFTDWNNPSATYYQLFLWLSIDERKEWNPTHVPVARHFWQWVIPTINLAERPMLPLSLLTWNSSAGTLWRVSLHIGKSFRTPNTLISKRSSSHVASYIIFVSANNLTHHRKTHTEWVSAKVCLFSASDMRRPYLNQSYRLKFEARRPVNYFL